MRHLRTTFTNEEINLAMNYVSYVIYNATREEPDDEDGIFVNVRDFIKFIPYDDIQVLASILNKTSTYEGLDKKVLDWITEE